MNMFHTLACYKDLEWMSHGYMVYDNGARMARNWECDDGWKLVVVAYITSTYDINLGFPFLSLLELPCLSSVLLAYDTFSPSHDWSCPFLPPPLPI